MSKHTPTYSPRRSHQAGLTLIELMIAVLLGFLVIAAGMGLLLSNRKTYGTTQAVSRIQENQRVAFEMLSADIRSAGDYPCLALSQPGRVVAQVDKGFWNNYFEQQRAGMKVTKGKYGDILTVYLADNRRGQYMDAAESMGYRYAVIEHDSPEGPIKIKDARSFHDGNKIDIVICNADRAVVFHATGFIGNDTIEHKAGLPGASGSRRIFKNCGSAFVYDPSNNSKDLWNGINEGKCGETIPTTHGRNRYCFGPNAKVGENGCDRVGNSPAFVVNMSSSDTEINWFLDDNSRGGRSLYRRIGATREEIVEGVVDMELTYLLHGETEYKTAAAIDPDNYGKSVPDSPYIPVWGKVDSVHVKLTFEASGPEEGARMDKRGTDGNNIARVMENYVAIRNKLRNQPDSK